MKTFDKPDAPGSTRDPDAPQWDPAQHLGDLLVIQVSDVKESIETEYGDRPCVVADVFVVHEEAGTIATAYPEAWLFGTVLYSQLRAKKGRTVLGVLEQGEKKPGKKPPWRLADPTSAQEETAIRAMTSKPDAAEAEPARQPAAAAAGKAPWED
jgi:hypothetical protein